MDLKIFVKKKIPRRVPKSNADAGETIALFSF
jgi:hypothetical protein